MRSFVAIAAGLALAVSIDAGAAEIFRCSTPGGSIAYQQFPCAPNNDAGKMDVPGAYPDVDHAARERLFQREAAADARLEAQRERLSREEMTRVAARAQVAAAQAAAAIVQPADVVFVTRSPHYRRHARMGRTVIR